MRGFGLKMLRRIGEIGQTLLTQAERGWRSAFVANDIKPCRIDAQAPRVPDLGQPAAFNLAAFNYYATVHERIPKRDRVRETQPPASWRGRSSLRELI
jgi:hypothetical protein